MKLAITGKGGVGKTTLAALLAQVYADAGRQVLAVDADPSPCLAGALGFPDALRANLHPISEMDEELTYLNGGQFPLDPVQKHTVLAPQVIEKVLKTDNIIFFTNTDYFTPSDLQKAKSIGFKIFQIEINYQELVNRNAKRVKEENYQNLDINLKDMLVYQEDIKDKGLVDEVIDGTKPISEIIDQLKKSF